MDSVTSPNEAVIENPVETTSTTPSATGEKNTTETPAKAATVEQTGVTGQNPSEVENYKKALKESREKMRETQRELAQLRTEGQRSKYDNTMDPNQTAALYADPRFQELLIKVAKQELTDYTREILSDDRYSSIAEPVKKAILKNVRGFVNETTTDPETAKVDILDYIESLLEETGTVTTPPAKTGFPIAATNTSVVDDASTTPAEIAEITSKSMDQITDEEAVVLENYLKTQNKKSKK